LKQRFTSVRPSTAKEIIRNILKKTLNNATRIETKGS
jgi:hypothetical protein